ncbi:MAG TPA: adenylate/guanylate cyclase domain-containing protein [Myxococcales bacterium]|nr:adenylate/guanylate cyclase domain-containing protein [Myxococcales bacterium]
MRAHRITLEQSFAGALAVVAGLLVALAAFSLDGSRRSILASAERLRAAEAARVDAQVRTYVDGVTAAVDELKRELAQGLKDPEAAVLRELQRNPLLAEVSFVHAQRIGFDEHGTPLLAAGDRWQVSAFRKSDGSVAAQRITEPDPTAHLTFRTTASKAIAGRAIWTDLSWSQLDQRLPEEQRRVVVSVQQAATDASGAFAGVVRVALLASAIDGIAVKSSNGQQVFIADGDGRLITRISPENRLVDEGDALRVSMDGIPASVGMALAGPLQEQDGPERSDEIKVNGERWLATFHALAGSQGWFVGIVVPEAAYTSELQAMRWWLVAGCSVVVVLALLGGGVALIALRRGFRKISAASNRLRGLDFEPAQTETVFRDVHEVLTGLEQAKTALRGMGKYAPLDLVRELYAANREPALGGELRELSILFTDLEGFTSLAEHLSADRLANALGLYFEAMTQAIRSCGGTIDKFIGDSVMALWNAPTRHADHTKRACAAIIACREATALLYKSEAWGLPPLRTRFGLHKAEVMVGHFGAMDRFSYTALGDGVNLASRLEGLCKQYEVEAIVSQTVVDELKGAFAVRRLDLVAVKGRKEGMMVYELGLPNPNYEAALGAYLRGEFMDAMLLFAGQPEDRPSRVMLARCRKLLKEPPEQPWTGVHVALGK